METKTSRLIAAAPLVVTDFDGTLATLATDWDALRARLAAEADCLNLFWSAGKGLDFNLRRLRQEYSEETFRWMCSRVAPAELAGFDARQVNHDLLKALRQRGDKPLAVFATNTRRAVSTILRHPVFAGITPCLIAKEDVQRSKPHPEGLLRACTHFGVTPTEAVYLGHKLLDERTAEAAAFGNFIRITISSTSQRRSETKAQHTAGTSSL